MLTASIQLPHPLLGVASVRPSSRWASQIWPARNAKAATLDQRKALYAPWSPDQMAQRRKEQGLKGPGTTKTVPAPAFPSYLKKPNSVEELMPQARAAARQTGGRTPLGLALPGKTDADRRRRGARCLAQHDGAGGDQARAGGTRHQDPDRRRCGT